jgi:uncharacterized repeat protein (TIGR03847 family)
VAEPIERDLGDVDEIDAEAIGEPGHRTFRLLTEQGTTTLSLWVEKEQLEALAIVIDQQMAQVAGEARDVPAIATLAARFPGRPTIDFKAGRLAVGYDADRRRLVFTAHELEDVASNESAPAYRWAASRPQVLALSAKIAQIVAAGRPRCPLCGAPIEGNHVCPATTGRAH